MTRAQSIKNFIDNHSNILIVPGRNKKMDNLAASYALALVIEKFGKKPIIYFAAQLPHEIRFLNIQKFLIKTLETNTISILINTEQIPLEKVESQKENGALRLVLHSNETPKITKEAISIENNLEWDGVIYMGHGGGGPILKNLSNPDILNIEPNESSGSVSENLVRALKELDETCITEAVSTSLLTGIVASTKNFQNPKIQPQTLFASAYLIAKSARNELIVQHLYKIKSLEMIKLWGSVIANFSYRDDKKIGYSFIHYKDIEKSNAQKSHITSLINELKSNFGQAELFVLGIEQPQNKNVAVIHALNPSLAVKFSSKTGAVFKNSSCILRLHPGYPIKTATEKAVEEVAGSIL